MGRGSLERNWTRACCSDRILRETKITENFLPAFNSQPQGNDVNEHPLVLAITFLLINQSIINGNHAKGTRTQCSPSFYMFIEIFRFVEFSGKYFSRLIRTRQLALPMELDDTRCRRENQMLWKRRNWKKPETGTLSFYTRARDLPLSFY